MIARPYAIVCALLLLGMFGVAALIDLHLKAIGAPGRYFDTLILFFIPAGATAFALMWLLVSGMVPGNENQRRMPVATGTLAVAHVSAIAIIFCFCVGQVLGMSWLRLNQIFAVLALLMVVTGNVAGKLPPNHVMGFRTPWSLADEEVWDKTQRFGGWTMVIAGFALLNASLLFDLSTLNWVALLLACGSGTITMIASAHFARQKKKARDAAWRELTQ